MTMSYLRANSPFVKGSRHDQVWDAIKYAPQLFQISTELNYLYMSHENYATYRRIMSGIGIEPVKPIDHMFLTRGYVAMAVLNKIARKQMRGHIKRCKNIAHDNSH